MPQVEYIPSISGTRRHKCVQAHDRINFYSRPDIVLRSRNWINNRVHTYTQLHVILKVNCCNLKQNVA